MRRVTIPVVMRKKLVEQIEEEAKKQGLSRSRFIEMAVEWYMLEKLSKKPQTQREKFLKWLLTGEVDGW